MKKRYFDMTMDFLFVKNILDKCGVVAKLMTNGYIFFMKNTKEQVTEAEAMDLVEDYLVSKIAHRIETGKVQF